MESCVKIKSCSFFIMKITLIQTPWSEGVARDYKGIARRYALYPPLGLMHLAASVEKAGHEADIIDLEVENLQFDELCKRITASGAQMIGLTSTSPVFHIARALARALKNHLPLPIVLGGPHITVLKREAFTDDFDFGVVGEGEVTLPELMTEYCNGKKYSQIKGLICRDGTQVTVNAPRPFIKDLDSLPFPARHKVDPNNYVFEVPGKGLIPVGTIELTRGCPFKCVFCSEPLLTGVGLRKRSPKSVVDEMLEIGNRFGITHFFLLDSTLTVNRRLIEGFCNEVMERKAKITFEGQTRANLVDEPLLRLMQKAGLTRLSFGVESGNPEVLRLMKKEVDPDDMRNAFRLCGKLGISTMCGLMMGNPGDTKRTIMQSAWFVRSIPEIRYAPLAIAVPYPGTELMHMAEHGMHGLKLLEKDYTKYTRYAGGVMEVNGMKPQDLIKLQRRALIVTHSTPRKFWGLIQHFGIRNVLRAGSVFLKNEIVSAFGGTEPVLRRSVAEDNTTLKSLGLASQR
jgi:anaerobic magnesium-protoporphyrin IX monomethyl ester cyclase